MQQLTLQLTLHNVVNLSTPFLQAYQHQFASFSPFCKQFEDKNQLIKDKGSTMVQLINALRNNSLVNLTSLPLLHGNSGANHMAQLSLTVGWQAGRQTK